jgi:uncharacterized membrane protein YgaE (UPF0421/DUF939 family)
MGVGFLLRLRGRFWPILQTALAATAAWWFAALALPDGRPSFAAIAAVVCLGASHGQRGSKALQLVAGVVLGICVASFFVALIGSGTLQIGLMVALAMTAATLLGGGELLTSESAVSAILIVSLDPGAAAGGFTANRILEGVIGGAVALTVSALLFPADPRLAVARAAQSVFGGLGGALERLSAALEAGDPAVASEALESARALDLTEFSEELALGRETARLSPRHRPSVAALDRYGASFAQVDYAIRDTRVLARHAVRTLRSGVPAPGLSEAVRELSRAVWSLAAAYDDPDEAIGAHAHALRAASLADDATPEVAGQVRSIAVDLRRAADLVDTPLEDAGAPTEELLAAAV